MRTTSSPSCCNCCCGRNWSCCRRHARPPPLRRATASSLALLIHLSPGAAAAAVLEPTAASSDSRSAGHSCSPATEGGPLSLTGFSLQIVCSLLNLAWDPPPHSLAGVEDEEEETGESPFLQAAPAPSPAGVSYKWRRKATPRNSTMPPKMCTL